MEITALILLQLLDLCILDVACLEYPYSALAASALYHFSNAELVEKVSGKNSKRNQDWLVC